MADIEQVVRESSQGYNIPEVVRYSGEQSVKTFDWVKFFHSLGFVPIPNILKYHSFRCNAANPGCVFVKLYSDSAENMVQVIQGATPDLSLLPEEVKPKGLELERQWYLYEKIRPLCHTNLARDLTCPKPTLPKPRKRTWLLQLQFHVQVLWKRIIVVLFWQVQSEDCVACATILDTTRRHVQIRTNHLFYFHFHYVITS